MLAALAFACLGLVVLDGSTNAQQITILIQFTNVWKYDQSGMELGATWRTNDYDDSAWSSGAGLLGVDNTVPGAYPPHLTSLIVDDSLITYYFRTTFEFFGETNGVILIASNYIDDGAVIYLNGREAGRFRVSAGQISTTRSSGGNVEGALDVLSISPGLLRQGTNLVAVELHQSFVPATDLTWGMRLVSFRPTALSITNQSQSQIAMVGDPVTFQVGVLGGPAYYQWQKDGVNILNGGAISGATSNVLRISSSQIVHSGIYRVIVTNAISGATSSPVTLTVVADTTGPRLVSAVVREARQTNEIVLQFSENLQPRPASNTSSSNVNYRVTSCATGRDMNISNSMSVGSAVLLQANDSDWIIGDCYVVTVNNITDTRGNRIAPDSQIGVSWPRQTPILDSSHPWRFHNSAIFEPGIADNNWYACDFPESFWWTDGYPCFYFLLSGSAPCAGALSTQIGFQPEPALFRTWFNWPGDLPTEGATLRPRFAIDDGAVFYLNGVEIYRHNMPTGPINSSSKATAIVTTPVCVTNLSWPVTNLLSGSNCFAVAVFQATGGSEADTVFCFELDIGYLQTPPLPSEIEPTLAIIPFDPDAVRLSWAGGGYALESATNLTDNPASYPFGPWQQVTNMSNPYTNSLAAPSRFFRLKK